jgi:hypothetical protein
MIRKPESPVGRAASIVCSVISLGAAALLFVVMAMVPKVDGYAIQDAKAFGLVLLVPVFLILLGLFLFWFGTPDDIDLHKRRMRLLIFQLTIGVLLGLPTLSWIITLMHLAIVGSWRFHHH